MAHEFVMNLFYNGLLAVLDVDALLSGVDLAALQVIDCASLIRGIRILC